MKTKIAVLAALLVTLFAAPSYAQESMKNAATSVRASAVLTTADVLSTTFTVPSDVVAVDIYVDYTAGSLTNAVITPAGSITDATYIAPGSFYGAVGYQKTVTTTGTYVIRIPRSELATYRKAGVFIRGTGTVTDSLAVIRYKLDYGT